jgi:hypothetical protein
MYADSILFITLDSCRYDSFAASSAPHLKSLGPLFKAAAPGYFTYSSHAAMFMGFTPGVANLQKPLINPKFAKLFKMVGAGWPGKGDEFMTLEGRNIIDGLKRKGYRTIGSAAMGWFDPETETGQVLTKDFERFHFSGTQGLRQQLRWVFQQINEASGPTFVFLNIGETHVPYFHEDAPWDPNYNPCVPFSTTNDAAECRRRQIACVEWADTELAPLLDAFANQLIIVCADHGDCWGEDDLWEHGIYHPKVVEVPLIIHLPSS